MSSLTVKCIACVIGLAFAAASVPADAAKARKPKKSAARHTSVQVQGKYRGTNLYRAGAVYNGQDYLGDDPDPFIRSQIFRDMGARYGGEP